MSPPSLLPAAASPARWSPQILTSETFIRPRKSYANVVPMRRATARLSWMFELVGYGVRKHTPSSASSEQNWRVTPVIGVGVLAVRVEPQPLARHRRRAQAHGLDLVAAREPHLDLDLVDVELDEPRRVLGEQVVHDVAVHRLHARRVLALELGQQVEEDARRHLVRDAAVEHRAVELVERHEQEPLGVGGRADRRVREAAQEERLRRGPAALRRAGGGLLGAEVDLHVAADRVEPLEIVVLAQARELEQVRRGRPHVAPQRRLGVAVALVEREVARGQPARLRHDEAHHAHAARAQRVGRAAQRRLALGDERRVVARAAGSSSAMCTTLSFSSPAVLSSSPVHAESVGRKSLSLSALSSTAMKPVRTGLSSGGVSRYWKSYLALITPSRSLTVMPVMRFARYTRRR